MSEIEYPGHTPELDPEPRDEMRRYRGSEKLRGRRALITGGDSGIGRAVAAAFAKEDADVAIAYLSEDDDAMHTCRLVEQEGRRAHAIRCDLSREEECRRVVEEAAQALGGLERAAEPDEIAPSYVFVASGELSSYYTGEVLAPIGGETLPGG